jgi:molecular chaperone HscB
MDAEDDPNLRTHLLAAIDKLQTDIYEPVKNIIENYQDGSTSEKELLQVKEYYYKKKYLTRIRKELA